MGQVDNNDTGRQGDQAAAIDNDDLDLVDASLEDEGKDDAELWDELDEAETGTTDDSAPDDSGAKEDDEALVAANPNDSTDEDPDEEPDEEPDDPFVNATPKQQAAWNDAQTQLAKLEQSDRSQRGRLGAMQRQVNDLMAKLSAAGDERAPASNKTATTKQSSPEGSYLESDEYKEFEDEYPEVAGPFGKIIGSLEKRLAKYDEKFSADEQAEVIAALDEQTDLLTESHPDWQQVLAADEGVFVDWVKTQPRHVQEAAYRNATEIVDAEEAADVFSRFKAFRSESGAGDSSKTDTPANGAGNGKPRLTGRRQRQLESATGARGSGPGVATGIPEDGDPKDLWDAFDKMEQRQAQRA